MKKEVEWGFVGRWKGRLRSAWLHLLTFVLAEFPELTAAPPRVQPASEKLMSCNVEWGGPWLEASGSNRSLSESRVIRNPSFSVQRESSPAASIHTSPEDVSPPLGWNWIMHTGGSEGEGKKNTNYMLLFIDPVVDNPKLFQVWEVFPASTAGIRGMINCLHKNSYLMVNFIANAVNSSQVSSLSSVRGFLECLNLLWRCSPKNNIVYRNFKTSNPI